MSQYSITLENCRGYASEANLYKGIERFGLTDIRRVICRKPDGKWTAVFLVSEWLNLNGGYAGIAGQYGFMSV